MVNKLYIALAFVLSLLSTPKLNAQWTFGGESGLQLNSVNVRGLTVVANRLTKSIITPFARISATYDINEKMGMRLGLGFSQKGFQVAQGVNINIFNVPIGIGAKLATKADYIEIPLEGVYTISKGSTTYIVTAGTNVGYATKARLIPKASFIIDIKVGEIPIDLNERIYNRWDMSATAGIGMIKKTDKGNLIFQARYVRSMSNFLNNPIADIRIKPFSYQFSIGYQATIGKKRQRV